MTNSLWINLPVKDIETSKKFFSALGFSFNTEYGNSPHSISLVIGAKKTIVMLFTEAMFESFTGSKMADASKANEVLLSFDASSREEVDEWAAKAEAAGGNVFHKPAESQGWMYGCGFTDPDAHRWNVLYMDMAKMPK